MFRYHWSFLHKNPLTKLKMFPMIRSFQTWSFVYNTSSTKGSVRQLTCREDSQINQFGRNYLCTKLITSQQAVKTTFHPFNWKLEFKSWNVFEKIILSQQWDWINVFNGYLFIYEISAVIGFFLKIGLEKIKKQWDWKTS